MKMLKILFALLFLLQWNLISGYAEFTEESQKQCLSSTDTKQEKLLHSLNQLSQSFTDLHSLYEAHRILVYERLWAAHRQSQDSFSATRRDKGAVLIIRHEHYVEEMEQDIERVKSLIQNHMSAFDLTYTSLGEVCSIGIVENCVSIWRDRVEEPVDAMVRLINRYQAEGEELMTEVKGMLTESQSEHLDYQVRFRNQLQRWSEVFYPDFVKYRHTILETLEYDWLAETCCELCSQKNIHAHEDPIEMNQRLKRAYEHRWERKAFEDNRT